MSMALAACGATGSASSTAKPATIRHTKTEAHSVDISATKLTGVDTQLRLVPSSSSPVSKGLSTTAVAPASIATAGGAQTISLPIVGGNFTFDTTDHHITGIVDHSGGFRLTGGSSPAVTVVDLNINLSTKVVTATVNGSPNVPLFTLSGTADLARQGVHDVITGLTASVSPHTTAAVKAMLGSSGTVGDLTITASTTA